MELVLVLVLLVVIGSLAIPPIISAFSSVKLRRAGDAVMSRWAQARALAIETGTPYQFRFTPETGDYRVEPWSGVATDAPAGDAASESTASAKVETPATQKSLDEKSTIAAKLPDTILFQGGQSARLEPTSGERQVASLKTPESSWSTPILFFPDGTCTQATIVLQSDVPNFLRLTLRGLTGVARASGVLTREEMERGSQTP
jgi:Tfp pilus assembly protein FimT